MLFISIHRYDNGSFYPGPKGSEKLIGSGKGTGFNLSYPFNLDKNDEDLIGDKDYIYACESILFPVIKLFNPDLIIISAGFDSALGDPVG